jgi:hypothetical protein
MAKQNSTSMEQGGRSTNLLSDVVLLAWWRSWGRSLRSPVVGVRRPVPPSSGRWRPTTAAVGAVSTAGCGCCAAASAVGAVLALDAAPSAGHRPRTIAPAVGVAPHASGRWTADEALNRRSLKRDIDLGLRHHGCGMGKCGNGMEKWD